MQYLPETHIKSACARHRSEALLLADAEGGEVSRALQKPFFAGVLQAWWSKQWTATVLLLFHITGIMWNLSAASNFVDSSSQRCWADFSLLRQNHPR